MDPIVSHLHILYNIAVPWIITASVFLATVLLMDDVRNAILLAGAVILVGFVVPCWKLVAQARKRLLRGPWDIPSLESMQLVYKNELAKNVE
jgi:hypothetical protein